MTQTFVGNDYVKMQMKGFGFCFYKLAVFDMHSHYYNDLVKLL